MYILGLNIGHNATACLLKDGKIASCVSEERFSRIKNHSGIPLKSINWILKDSKIEMKDIDMLVLDNHYTIDKDPNFGKKFINFYKKKSFLQRRLASIGYNNPVLYKFLKFFKKSKKSLSEIKLQLSKQLRFPLDKILMIDHHLAHAYSTCFNLPKDKKTLVFTLDGEGSGISASVNIFENGKMKVLSKTPKEASLGYLYSTTTLYLGMKPLEHEFKVMGLAPYAKEHNILKVYDKIKDLFVIDENLRFRAEHNMIFNDIFLDKNMRFERFDCIAGAVQKLLEELVCKWVSLAVKKTGISDIALSGGVFMNVKAAMEISKLPGVNSLFVMPSAGDESNPIGCCFYGCKLFCNKNKIKFEPQQLTHLYLGPEYDNKYVESLIKERSLDKKYKISKGKKINKVIAVLLAGGNIVARCSGRSEWGARALGNRSILANPANKDTIRILNETIKDRDFWMPFTPSILDSFEKKYIINPKKVFAPYMAITFNSTKLAWKHLTAAMHPYDFTIRPQIVTKRYNKDYYEIIENFMKITGIGGILNTSFNLHGEPNVLTPEDALHTFENSDLRYLAVNDYLFEKIAF